MIYERSGAMASAEDKDKAVNLSKALFNKSESLSNAELANCVIMPGSLLQLKSNNEKISLQMKYRAFYAEIRIYDIARFRIQQLQRSEEEKLDDLVRKITSEKIKIINESILNPKSNSDNELQKNTLSEVELEKLYKGFEFYIKKLDSQIGKLLKLIEKKREAIQVIENEMVEIKNNLENEFKRFYQQEVQSMYFETVKFSISLPQQYKGLRGSERYHGLYELTNDDYVQIFNKLLIDTEKDISSPDKLSENLKIHIDNHIRQMASRKLHFVSDDIRDEMLSAMMRSNSVEKISMQLYKNIYSSLLADDQIKKSITEYTRKSVILEGELASIACTERLIDSLKSQRGYAIESLNNYAKIFDVTDVNSVVFQDSACTWAVHLTALEENVSSLMMNSNIDFSSNELTDIASIIQLSDTAISDIDRLLADVEKMDLAGDLSAKKDEIIAAIDSIETKFDSAVTEKMTELYSKKEINATPAAKQEVEKELADEVESFRPKLR